MSQWMVTIHVNKVMSGDQLQIKIECVFLEMDCVSQDMQQKKDHPRASLIVLNVRMDLIL